MAEIAKGIATPSLSTPAPSFEHIIVGFLAGEDIAAGDACYVAADLTIMRCSGAAADIKAWCMGFATHPQKNGQAITIAHGVMFRYDPKTNPGGVAAPAGTRLYLSGTVAGALADAASTGGTLPVAISMGDGRIYAKSNL